VKYEIKTIHDDYDCETCGASFAEGYQIYRDGELVHEMKPVAHCFGGENFTVEDWAAWILRDLGHEIVIDGYEGNFAAVKGCSMFISLPQYPISHVSSPIRTNVANHQQSPNEAEHQQPSR
jgi:hypothetical protein